MFMWLFQQAKNSIGLVVEVTGRNHLGLRVCARARSPMAFSWNPMHNI
jgi:hypothetical protein